VVDVHVLTTCCTVLAIVFRRHVFLALVAGRTIIAAIATIGDSQAITTIALARTQIAPGGTVSSALLNLAPSIINATEDFIGTIAMIVGCVSVQ